jgi:tetratricopeptide (TPR) repeat protein
MFNALTRSRYFHLRVVQLFLLCVFTVTTARAQTLDDDFAFASGLVEWGFSDFALKYAESLQAANPGVADRVNLIRAQGLIASRKFSEAEDIVRRLPSGSSQADAIRLALANAYFASGEDGKASAIYQDFFNRFPDTPSDPDLLRFYRDAAFRYAGMLEKSGDLPAALTAYERVLNTNPENDVARRIKTERSQILLKLAQQNHNNMRDDYAYRTRQAIDDIQWGGVDLWFGQSIITLANVELVYNDINKAQEVLDENMEILEQIETLLEESNMPRSLSPMAGARFLSGEMSRRAAGQSERENNPDEALKNYAAALNEFYNVFVQYGESDFGPEAGVQAQAVKDILESRYGRTIKIDLGERAGEAAETAVRLGDTLYRQRKFTEAADAYLRAANQFPEQEPVLKSFGNLLLAYANLDNTLMVKAIASYVGERFAGQPDGANALLAAAKFYVDNNRADMFGALYDIFLAAHPEHERAGTVLFYLASQLKKAGDEAAAASYLRRIIDNYPQDQYYPAALNQVAFSYYQTGDFETAITYFRRLINETTAGIEQAQARFNLADALSRLNRFAESAAEYSGLLKEIGGDAEVYRSTEEVRNRVRDLQEKSSYQLALCLARITEPAERVNAYRQQAIKAYQLFVNKYGDSELAPRALNGMGTVQLELQLFDDATATFDELARKYPNSEEGKNALFSLARAAMEIGEFDQGVAAFNRMMSESARFQPEEFIRLGIMMGDAGYAREAISAFSEVQKKVQALPAAEQEAKRPLIERALFGGAQAYYKAERYEEAIQTAQELLTRYPQSGLFYEAKFIECEAYRDLGRNQEAVTALNDVINFATDSALINRATVTLAGIQRNHGELTEALASYQRLALLADRNDPANLPLIESAFLASVEIAAELQRYQDVIANADDYAELFPQGQHIETIRAKRREAIQQSAAMPQGS